MGKFLILTMLNLASGAAIGAMTMVNRSDVPKQYRWAVDCPYDKVNFDNFKHFSTLHEHIKSRDQCMGIGSYMFTIQDVNDDMKLNKCEHMYGCLASLYEKGQDEEQDNKNGLKCAKAITAWKKMHPKRETIKTVGEICAHEFPSLKGSPLPHD